MTRYAAAIVRLTPPRSVYVQQAEGVLSQPALLAKQTYNLREILVGLRTDIEHGYLTRVEQEAREEVFDDLLAMATEINARMHPAPAAVLAGAVLEEHFRQLARANDIDPSKPNGDPLPFEQVGHALVKAQIIREPERKQAASWYAWRTEGAHGHFENVEATETARAIEGVRDFMIRHPA